MDNSNLHVYQVCIPHSKRAFFDYLGEAHFEIGMRVWVPFGKGNKKRLGIIVGEGTASSISLKLIDSLIDSEPIISFDLLTLCQWLSDYYQSSLSEVLPFTLPGKLRKGAPLPSLTHTYYQLAMEKSIAEQILPLNAKKQKLLLTTLSDKVYSQKDLYDLGFKKAYLDSFIEKNIFKKIESPLLVENGDYSLDSITLNEAQSQAVHTIVSKLQTFQCLVLKGVTGSGKTEVYLEAIKVCLEKGLQALVLVPEIGLTPQLMARFKARLNAPLVVIHSHLTENQRAEAWCLAAKGHAQLVLGTRAAVFTPLPRLGLIIIDEEHDHSFKQMEGVRYHAKNVAIMRALKAKVPIVLGSATPSLETLYNIENKKFQMIELTEKALSTHALTYRMVDLRTLPLQEGIAQPTLAAIQQHLNANNQVLIFINRRGFAPVLMCHLCGWMADCPRCDSHLTLHKSKGALICHHCGWVKTIFSTCPKCNSPELIPIGLGTQKIESVLKNYFPTTEILRIDRDEVKNAHDLKEKLTLISENKAKLIIGTQMLAKGHHFPNLTLVVIIDADSGLFNTDFRALEKLGQCLLQVSGRAGRASQKGEVIIQTHQPQHPYLNTLIQQGYEAFAAQLLASRREAHLPPYSHMALIRVEDRKEEKVRLFLQNVQRFLSSQSIETLGPAPAPLARKAHYFRMQLLVKSAGRKQLNHVLHKLRHWLENHPSKFNLRWNIDVDPIDLA